MAGGIRAGVIGMPFFLANVLFNNTVNRKYNLQRRG